MHTFHPIDFFPFYVRVLKTWLKKDIIRKLKIKKKLTTFSLAGL